MRKILTLAAVTTAAVTALTLSSCSADLSTSTAGSTSGSTAADPAAAKGPSFYDKYGTFDTITQTGTTDGVITLPDAKAGIVTAQFTGEGNFAIQGLDETNQSTGDLLANTIGNYSGTSVYGMNSLGNTAKTLQVTGAGNWTITVAPIATAAALPAAGHGDGVFKYDGKATTLNLSNTGTSNYAVSQYPESGMNNLLVNEIGAYTGAVPATAGPSVVVITSDGEWKTQ
jgi:hypothetical protein